MTDPETPPEAETPPRPEMPLARVHRPIRDAIARHARPLIAELERKIHDEFGCEVKIGCEKELFIDGVDDAEIVVHTKIKIRHGFTQEHQVNQPDSRIIEGFEEEGFSRQFEFQTAPTSPLRAVVRLDGQCQNTANYFGRLGHEVSYVPYRPSDKATSALHVNFSVWKDGKNLCSRDCPASKTNPFRLHLGRKTGGEMSAIVKYLGADHLLIAPTEEAHSRYHTRFVCFNPDDLMDLKNAGDDLSRHEFRVPSSDARHDLSVLMVLAGVYRLLEGRGWESSAGVPDFPKTHEGSIALFENHSRLMPDLMEMMEGNAEMQSHVTQMKSEIIAAARENRLQQPISTEVSREMSAGR